MLQRSKHRRVLVSQTPRASLPSRSLSTPLSQRTRRTRFQWLLLAQTPTNTIKWARQSLPVSTVNLTTWEVSSNIERAHTAMSVMRGCRTQPASLCVLRAATWLSVRTVVNSTPLSREMREPRSVPLSPTTVALSLAGVTVSFQRINATRISCQGSAPIEDVVK